MQHKDITVPLYSNIDASRPTPLTLHKGRVYSTWQLRNYHIMGICTYQIFVNWTTGLCFAIFKYLRIELVKNIKIICKCLFCNSFDINAKFTIPFCWAFVMWVSMVTGVHDNCNILITGWSKEAHILTNTDQHCTILIR